jgi:hypothetical protein
MALIMNLAPIPEFADPVKVHLRRSDWGQIPDVVIHAENPPSKSIRFILLPKVER